MVYALKGNQALTREGALFENKRPDQLPRGAATESVDVPDETYSDGQIAAEAMVETVDVYPTLAELAGLPAREGLDG